MPSSRRLEIQSQVVVAVLSSLVICSIMFVMVQVQLGAILARHDEQIKELKVALAEAKACCRLKDVSAAPSSSPVLAAHKLAGGARHLIRHRRKRNHRQSLRQQVEALRKQVERNVSFLQGNVSFLQYKLDILRMMPNVFQLTADEYQESQEHEDNYTVRWRNENTEEILDSNRDPTFIADEDLVHSGRVEGIMVKKPGVYAINAQVKFNGFKTETPRNPYQTYYIMKKMGGTSNNVILLEKTITQAIPDRRNLGGIKAIDMAYSRKVFYLNTNDVVYLRIPYRMSKVIFDTNTYLGLVYYGDKSND